MEKHEAKRTIRADRLRSARLRTFHALVLNSVKI